MDSFEDPFFRGCTRPAMLWGVPLMPMLLVSGAFMLGGAWSAYLISGYVLLFLAVIYVPLIIMLRQITRHDDQRLRQWLLRLRMRIGKRAIRRRWGAYSYGPRSATRGE